MNATTLARMYRLPRMPGLAAAAAVLLAAALAPAGAARAAALSADDVAALVNRIPDADPSGKHTGPDPADAQKIYDEILRHGKEGVLALIGLLQDPGGDDYKARYVLHGLAISVTRPDAAKDRPAVCAALTAALADRRPKAVQAFLVQELQYMGGKEATAALVPLLLDEDLCDPATRALVAIGGTAPLLRQALPAAKGKCRLSLIQALGVLRDAPAAADLRRAAADPDLAVRTAARDALGAIGDAGAVDLLLGAADRAADHERIQATEAALVLGRRLLEAGKTADAERLYRHLWKTRTDPEERHVRIAALGGLADARGDMNDLLAAMKTGDPQIAAVAVQRAASTPGTEATMACVAAMQKAAPADRAALVTILGARRDPAALPAVLGTFKDSDESVRGAARHAAAAIGGETAAEALVASVLGPAGADRDAAADALGEMRGPEAGAAVAAVLKTASDAGARAALIGVLAARRMGDQLGVVTSATADADPGVRVAALKALGALGGEAQMPALVVVLQSTTSKAELGAAEEALAALCGRQMADRCTDLVVPALAQAAPANAAALLRVLAAAGTRKALDAAVAAAKSPNAEVKDAAIRSLAQWRTRDAASALLDVARSSTTATHQVLALRGAVRLASGRDMADDARAKVLGEALQIAQRPEEKREALAALGGIQTADALRLAATGLDDAAVQEEAAAAVVQIADRLARRSPDAVREAVAKALQVAKNDQVRAAAKRILDQVKKP